MEASGLTSAFVFLLGGERKFEVVFNSGSTDDTSVLALSLRHQTEALQGLLPTSLQVHLHTCSLFIHAENM